MKITLEMDAREFEELWEGKRGGKLADITFREAHADMVKRHDELCRSVLSAFGLMGDGNIMMTATTIDLVDKGSAFKAVELALGWC